MNQRLKCLKLAYPLLLSLLILVNYSAAGAIDSLKVRNFVVRSYIILTNSKPSREDIPDICRRFKLYEDFDAGSSQLLDTLLKSEAFCQNIFDRYRFEYLQGATIEQVYDELDSYQSFLSSETYRSQWDDFKERVAWLKKVASAKDDLAKGYANIQEVQKRFFYCNIYSEINMGLDNYVISMFNYLFFRKPTAYELQEAKKLCQHQPSNFFMEARAGDDADLFRAISSTDAYWEGQVRYWYKTLLNRDATLDELLINCSKSRDIKALIKQILKKKEFCGI